MRSPAAGDEPSSVRSATIAASASSSVSTTLESVRREPSLL